MNHLAFVSNAGHPAGALDEFIVNVNVNMHVVRPLYTCAGCVRPPARGMARVVAVFGPPRRVGRDVAVQRRFTPDDVFVIIAPHTGAAGVPHNAFGGDGFDLADDRADPPYCW